MDLGGGICLPGFQEGEVENNKKATLALIVLLILATLVTVYPVISNFLYDKHRSRVQTEYFAAIEQMDDAVIQKAKQEAEAYNTLLAKGVSPAFSDDQVKSAFSSYNELLNLNGDGTMCYIEIPVIAVNLSVAHSTEADTLEHSIGHVVGTSLPIGGSGTHAVLSGHSGMAGQRMFTDLHELKAGDMVYIHVLNEVLAYEVESLETVRPEDTASLSIVQSEDQLTLITCTPIGVNTHRLLVHCSRTEYTKAAAETAENAAPVSSSWQRQYVTGICYGMAALLLAYICYAFIRRVRYGKRT